MAKRQGYSFIDKSYSANSIAALVLGIISLLILLALLGAAFFMKGTMSSWSGAVGITGIVASFLGLRYGFAGFQDQAKSYLICKLATLLCTLCIASWFLIICFGLAH